MPMSPSLLIHLPMQKDTQETQQQFPTKSYRVTIQSTKPNSPVSHAAFFNGVDSKIIIPHYPSLSFGWKPFSISFWMAIEPNSDVVGDLLSKFDYKTRTGFGLSGVTLSGMTSTAVSNVRNLHFGIDSSTQQGTWEDCGRPGDAVKVCGLHVFDGNLFATTYELGEAGRGHLWSYKNNQNWEDWGATPDYANAIQTLTSFDGALYVGSSRYNPIGSNLGEQTNFHPGGNIYRIEPNQSWIYCGKPGGEDATPEEEYTTGYETGKADDAYGLIVHRGALFCTSNHRRGVYRYEGDRSWKYIGPHERFLSFIHYQGELYGLVNGGPIYRYIEDNEWEYCGTPANSHQTYAGVVHRGDLYVGTWPLGEVYRYRGGTEWDNLGSVGYEREIMAMAVYNQKMYVGTLPMANVHRLDEDQFTFIGNLDATPCPLRRVWTMAVYQGKLFAGTLPSGRVWAWRSGQVASVDTAISSGWHHIVAVRDTTTLSIYIDGTCVSQATMNETESFSISNDAPLYVGWGGHAGFKGAMADVRIYEGLLSPEQIFTEATQKG
jgi:hypothetical protein